MKPKKTHKHWDWLDENTLKGFSYKLKDGQMIVSGYLDISRKEKEIIYTAIVLNQNHAKAIDLKLTKTDSTFVFENSGHDFPKKIVHQKQMISKFSCSCRALRSG